MELSRQRNQMHSFAVSKAAMYSASHEEAATNFSLCMVHEIMPEPREHIYPPMLQHMSRQFAQSESV
jgi:hypothetical protein